MGWFWVIFLLFSVLGNFLEKMAKEQQASKPTVPDRKDDADLSGEWAERDPFPIGKPKPAPVPVGNSAPTQLPDYPKQQAGFRTSEERTDLFNSLLDFEAEDPMVTTFVKEDLVPSEADQGMVAEEASFHSAFVLAQVLARPDFRTIPWRRRL